MNTRLYLPAILAFAAASSLQVFADENTLTSDIPKISDAGIHKNPLATLDDLIDSTQKILDNQKKIRDQIIAFQKLQNSYQSTQDKELIVLMVKTAHKLLENIKENHLTQVFDPDFLSELTVFAQVATKRGIPKP